MMIVILYHSIDNFVMAVCFNNFMSEFNSYSIVSWILRIIVLVYIVIDLLRHPVKQLNQH